MSDGIELAIIVGGAAAAAAFFIEALTFDSDVRREADAFSKRVEESLDAAIEEITASEQAKEMLDAADPFPMDKFDSPCETYFLNPFSRYYSYRPRLVRAILSGAHPAIRQADLLTDAFTFQFAPEGPVFWWVARRELLNGRPLPKDAFKALKRHLRAIHETEERHWRGVVAEKMSKKIEQGC